MDLHKLVETYRTPHQVIEELKPIQTVMLTGITGAGKDTIIGDIQQQSNDFVRVVTSTTRAPRKNNGVMEQEGREYYFLTLDQAAQNIQNGEYIEVASVHDRINGSLISEYRRIASLGKIALTDIDYQGVERFLSFGMDHLSVYFVVPPNFEVWLARLLKRQGGVVGDHDEILRRFRSAQVELENAQQHQDFIPIMNDVSAETAQKIIEYTNNGTRPSDDEQATARQVIESLRHAIDNYVGQIEEA